MTFAVIFFLANFVRFVVRPRFFLYFAFPGLGTGRFCG